MFFYQDMEGISKKGNLLIVQREDRNMANNTVKNSIKEVAMKTKGWSIYKLAQELDLPQQTVYSWAWNKTQPNYKNLLRICHLLECSMEDIFEEAIRKKKFLH